MKTNADYHLNRRKAFEARGLCNKCGLNPSPPGIRCQTCRDKVRGPISKEELSFRHEQRRKRDRAELASDRRQIALEVMQETQERLLQALRKRIDRHIVLE
jgi:hypothetical protein